MSSLSKDGLTADKPVADLLWQWDGPPALYGCGARELLGLELSAFLPPGNAQASPFVPRWTGLCSRLAVSGQ